ALLRCKASPNLRVRLRFAPRKPPNYLANSAQHLIGGAIAEFCHIFVEKALEREGTSNCNQ
ncbi:MAG: hypothetical protein LBS32_05995, partial [Clostridiales Family XIII bacterium]|nr:hypothetical protein [Clostridiales Family XIII bacterium]